MSNPCFFLLFFIMHFPLSQELCLSFFFLRAPERNFFSKILNKKAAPLVDHSRQNESGKVIAMKKAIIHAQPLKKSNFNALLKRKASLFSTTALVAAGLVALSTQPAFAVGDLETPTGGQVVGGSATITLPQAGQLDINQSSNRTVINWNTFNIGQSATTQFFQPGSGSLAVNRVTGAGSDPAQILGTLKANGQVMVLDRNGVLFGKDATINVGGIIASTGDIDTSSVMNGDSKLVLDNFGSGAIVNNATINVADAGLAAFVSPHITNNGVLNAKLGT